MRRRACAAAAALVQLAGCAAGREPAPSPSPVSTTLDALGAAIRAVNRTRQAVLDDAAGLVAAARAVDEGDEAAARGDRRTAIRLRPSIDLAVRTRDAADRRIQAGIAAYGKAVEALDAVGGAPDLAAEHRAALAAVVRTARLETAADTRFATAVRSAWPAYATIHERFRTWTTRATAGWYRNDREAADAYAVLVSDHRSRLEAARTAFQQADAARTRATDSTSRAIEDARRVLAVLGRART
jgi:hypothetical protein